MSWVVTPSDVGFAKMCTNRYFKMYKMTYQRELFRRLYSAACYGLCQAASKYDSKFKVEFTSFAYYRIMGAITDELRFEYGGDRHFLGPTFVDAKFATQESFSDPTELIYLKQRCAEIGPEANFWLQQRSKSLREVGDETGYSKSWMSRRFRQFIERVTNVA